MREKTITSTSRHAPPASRRGGATTSTDTTKSTITPFKLTTPATVALVGYVLLILIVLLPFRMYVYDPRENAYVKRPYDFSQRLLLVIMLFFPFFLGVYSVNCMMIGDCRLWSWIIAVATLIWAALVVVTALHYQAFRLDDVVY
jgi:predicted transporter